MGIYFSHPRVDESIYALVRRKPTRSMLASDFFSATHYKCLRTRAS